MSTAEDVGNDHAAWESDAAARERIRTDLDCNMLVEAGAGSGKTTSLVGRMCSLVMQGEPVERIAAVTFTRKAANELRERFQNELERRLAESEADSEARLRCERALREIDRAFLGTIHSFCARILREHPLEISLDPNFAEVSENGWEELCRTFWNRWLERCKARGDAMLAGLASLSVDPQALYRSFARVLQYMDVDFPLVETVLPETTACRGKLEALLGRAREMMPKMEPEGGRDELMKLVKRLEYARRSDDWSDAATFCATLEQITATSCAVTQNRWGSDKVVKNAARDLGDEFAALLEGEIAEVLGCWYEFRYPPVMRFLKRASEDFARERYETGQLGFEDLLMLSAKLLREHPRVRDALGMRYRRLLVDEFQDTDPVQAEVCFLLASESSEGNDWHNVKPRAGAIFLVGDPKQSIYRFRRADIQVYEFAKERMAAHGVVLALTRNFRSVTPIAEFVDRYFQGAFGATASDVQAAFTPMHAMREAGATDGVKEYTVTPAKRNVGSIVDADCALVASWIAQRVASGECEPGDFLILTAKRDPVARYARALAERNIPVTTAGAKIPRELELSELLLVLHAIADPDNAIAVVAALEGLFFGCGPADLYDAHADGIRFRVTSSPGTGEGIVVRALRQLHEWWMVSQQQSADVLLERLLDDTGLLYFAASQTLGDVRAGALMRVVETLREASLTGASGTVDAIDRIELLLSQDSDDATLIGGGSNAVRVMNLHKAKGLEAKVVILAAPTPDGEHPPKVHVTRGTSGPVTSGIVLESERKIIARPTGWAAMAAEECGFAQAEKERLRYVAATRAARELVIACCKYPPTKGSTGDRQDTSAWAPFATVLGDVGGQLEMQVTPAPGRRTSEQPLSELLDAIAAANGRVMTAATPSLTRCTVTESARDERERARAYDLPRASGRGVAWGRAVHRCIEAAGRGRTGAALSAFAAAVVADEELNDECAAELCTLVSELQRSDVWKQLMRGENARFELPVMHVSDDGGRALVTEGVIDAAALTDDKWLVVDWKTDAANGDEWGRRKARYDEQVGAYEAILTALSQRPATSEIHRIRGDGAE
ncbi:MAG TPA: UvrD-helicase domain-containing protein [Gemmatimonadaceae bacterium]|nr:UvrD-helicase domain-containing protein [Gemmatimonadaceae bacterium]